MKKGGDPGGDLWDERRRRHRHGYGTGKSSRLDLLSDKQLQLQKNMHANNLNWPKTAPGPAIWIRRRRS